MCISIVKGSFILQDMLLNLHEFAFEGQNMKLTVNTLITCILYCAPGPAVIRTVCKHKPQSFDMQGKGGSVDKAGGGGRPIEAEVVAAPIPYLCLAY